LPDLLSIQDSTSSAAQSQTGSGADHAIDGCFSVCWRSPMPGHADLVRDSVGVDLDVVARMLAGYRPITPLAVSQR
jgi:hypothetical protein